MADASYLSSPPRSELEILETTEIPAAVIRRRAFPVADLRTLFDGAFGALFPALAAAGIKPVAPPFSLYTSHPGATVDIDVGVPIERPLAQSIEGGNGYLVEPASLPAGQVATISHLGAYDGLGQAWGGFMNTLAARGERPGFPLWEVYVTEPTPETAPETLRTDLYVLLS
ncbi:AraC family transcriptional regulator [Arsenicitalea aurantiaca]|uniref:AraC family transcriptional regulator n=1 Tax=Arsenicitalea aurantiaca TaxID=1783274 RepID=A0A433XAL7_9HYPH|nr:GyrI-like domain-containing protein [Arsenicitalea aurantiaca]RUT31141.1 AraC family transcriptional regulator [Arsenicitalea aurantiaca]